MWVRIMVRINVRDKVEVRVMFRSEICKLHLYNFKK